MVSQFVHGLFEFHFLKQFSIFHFQFSIFNSMFQFPFIKNCTKQFKQYKLKIENLELKNKLKIEIWQFSIQF